VTARGPEGLETARPSVGHKLDEGRQSHPEPTSGPDTKARRGPFPLGRALPPLDPGHHHIHRRKGVEAGPVRLADRGRMPRNLSASQSLY
jgi:hypothetical protein